MSNPNEERHEPAFPQEDALYCDQLGACCTTGTGLTKHDYVTIEVLKGLVSNPAIMTAESTDIKLKADMLIDSASTFADQYFK